MRKKTLLLIGLGLSMILAIAVFPVHAGMIQELRVQVLDKDYSAVGEAQVTVVTPGSPEMTAVTNRSGTANFRDVAVGGHALAVRIGGKIVYRDHFAVPKTDGVKSPVLRVVIDSGKRRLDPETISANDLKAPGKSRKFYQAAVESIRKHDFQKALELLEQSLATYPEYARAHNARGVVLGIMGRTRESEASYRSAIQWDAKFVEPHFNLGKLLLESEKVLEARQELQQAVDLQKGHVPALELLISALLISHDENSAISLVHSLHSMDQDHPAYFHLKIASELEKHALFQLAYDQYSMALQDQPSESERQNAERALLRIKD